MSVSLCVQHYVRSSKVFAVIFTLLVGNNDFCEPFLSVTVIVCL